MALDKNDGTFSPSIEGVISGKTSQVTGMNGLLNDLIGNDNYLKGNKLDKGNYIGTAEDLSNDIKSRLPYVNTIEDLKKQTKYAIGDTVEVLGYYEKGDGATHKRKKMPVVYSGVDAVIGADGSIWGIVHSGEVNVSWFGAKGDGVTDDTMAIQKALNFGDFNVVFSKANYNVADLTFRFFSYEKYKNFCGNGAIINASGNIYFQHNSQTNYSNFVLKATNVFFEGIRFSSFNNMKIEAPCKMGRFNDSPAIPSWSLYWNNFENVVFSKGVYNITSIDDKASINNNNYTNCTFRNENDSLITFDRYKAATRPTYASNTFTSCDFSYNPAFNMLYDYKEYFGVTIIGGYLDSGTPLWSASSVTKKSMNILGLRNPGSEAVVTDVSSNIEITTGGARPQAKIPVGVVSLLETYPTELIGTGIRKYRTKNLPATGRYTLSSLATGTEIGTCSYRNITTGDPILYFGLSAEGFSCFGFNASKGDIIEITITGNANTSVVFDNFSITPGAGVYSSIPNDFINSLFNLDVTLNNGETKELITLPFSNYSRGHYKITLNTTNTTSSAGGSEYVEYIVSFASGGTGSINGVIKETIRSSVDGTGGASNKSGTTTITVDTSTGSAKLNIGMVNVANITAKVKITKL